MSSAQNVPENVPATVCAQPKTSRRQPAKRKETPRQVGDLPRGSDRGYELLAVAAIKRAGIWLAGDDPEEVVEWVRRTIDDDQVDVTITLPAKRPNLSPTDTTLLQGARRRAAPAHAERRRDARDALLADARAQRAYLGG